MGRFYKEVRKIIKEYTAIFDKFMGDGVLFYWIVKKGEDPYKMDKLIDSCINQLIGFSISIAKEWQEHIDINIDIQGMRCGGAIGDMLFISEKIGSTEKLHAIGDCINLAARLQSKADPNYFFVSNKLKTHIFNNDIDFTMNKPIELKNIGNVLSWKKPSNSGIF